MARNPHTNDFNVQIPSDKHQNNIWHRLRAWLPPHHQQDDESLQLEAYPRALYVDGAMAAPATGPPPVSAPSGFHSGRGGGCGLRGLVFDKVAVRLGCSPEKRARWIVCFSALGIVLTIGLLGLFGLLMSIPIRRMIEFKAREREGLIP